MQTHPRSHMRRVIEPETIVFIRSKRVLERTQQDAALEEVKLASLTSKVEEQPCAREEGPLGFNNAPKGHCADQLVRGVWDSDGEHGVYQER